MRTPCKVCNHEDVRKIHKEIEAGDTQQNVANRYGLTKASLNRHLTAGHAANRASQFAGARQQAARDRDGSPCGVPAHAPGTDLMERFLHQDRVLEEANEAGYSEHEARAKIISLRQQGFDCCADDLLYWLLPEIKGEYSKTDPLWTKQKTDPQLSRAGL